MIFFKKKVIRNSKGEVYLIRWILFRSERFSVYLHKIVQSDEDRDLHDHPGNFLSFILKGFYLEELQVDGPGVPQNVRSMIEYRTGSYNYKRAEQLHRLSVPVGRPVWTLVFRGPRRRNWGFKTPEGWVPHEKYLNTKFGKGNWS